MASVRKRTWATGGKERTAWVVDYFDQGGKRRLKTFERKKDADAYLVTSGHEVRQGTHTPDSTSVTVAEASERWLDHYRTIEPCERSTLVSFTEHVELHIKPRIGATKLSRLTSTAVVEFRDDLLRGMSRALAEKVLRSLRMILGYAQRRGLVAQNAGSGVKIKLKDREDTEVEIPTKSELAAMLAKASGRWRPLFITAAFTGLRASELRGLTWDNVDFEDRIIRVVQRADKWGEMGSPKSRTSRRDLPMTPTVSAALSAWKAECPNGPLGLVFPNTLGNVEMHTNVVRRGFHPTQIDAGIFDKTVKPVEIDGCPASPLQARYGFHSLRHFYASWLIDQNIIPKRIQDLLGHSSIQMTFDTYGKLFREKERRDQEGKTEYDRLAEAERALLASV